MAALRRLAATRHLISANIQRSLSASPSSLRRDNHPIQPPHTITQIPSLSPQSSSFSNVFDPLAASTRTATQGQLMSRPMDKCNPSLSAPGILGTGLAMGRARELLFLNMYKYDGVRMEMKRSFSSSASPVEQSNEKVQANANIIRPLSPHLPIYKPQTNSVASIFNRISGAYLSALIVVFYLLTIKMGPVCFTYYPFYQVFFYASKCTLISGELAVLAVAYHLFHSFPHLFSDLVAQITLRGKSIK